MIDKILNAYINNETRNGEFAEYSTDNIRRILDCFGTPQQNIHTIHIAGTNGKGSTAGLISRILTNNGYKTGLYTSPHLLKINERIKINGTDIQDTQLEKIITEIDSTARKHSLSLTYFDVLTAAAFIFFRNEKTEFAVIECGLGGRLDTTNIIKPLVSVITDISVDHERILGSTVEEITFEKAGIIKPGVTVITSNTEPVITEILRKTADGCASRIIISEDRIVDCRFTGKSFIFSYHGETVSIDNMEISFVPKSRIKNTCLALCISDILSSEYQIQLNKEILADTAARFSLEGRFEIGLNNPTILFDVAHNKQSVLELVNALKLYFPEKDFRIFVTLMSDKHPREVVDILREKVSNDINYIILNDKRNYIPHENHRMKKFFHNDTETIAENISENKINIFTGSFRLYSIYREIIIHIRKG